MDGDVRDPDDDNDRLLDADDACGRSSRAATVYVGECDSGVEKRWLADGCAVVDVLDACPGEPGGRARRQCVENLRARLLEEGIVTEDEWRRIARCASRIWIRPDAR